LIYIIKFSQINYITSLCQSIRFFVFKEIEVYLGFSISNVKAGENVRILDVTLVQSSCTQLNTSLRKF